MNAIVQNLVPNQTPVRASNTPTYEDYLKEADELGALEGKGKDSQIKFLLRLVDGAYHGVFNLEKDRRGANRDDAAEMSERYFKSKKSNAVFDRSARNIQKLISTNRRGIQLGCCPKWGKGQPLQAANEYVEQWMKYRSELDPKSGKHPGNGRKLNDAFNAFQLFITAQMKSASLLPADERNQLMFVKDKDEKTEMEKLDAIRKAIKKTGDQSLQVRNAYDLITQRITNIVKGVK